MRTDHAPWPHQPRGVNDTLAALAGGAFRVCLTSPTGTGKTWMLAALARHYLGAGRRVVLYTNRRLLLDQTSDVLAAYGLAHGVRAAGHADARDLPFQVASVQTEAARADRRDPHPADLALWDEAHSLTGPTAARLMQWHHDHGAANVGITATPIGLGALYNRLVTAATTSDGRKCGALVPARHFGPTEPDLSKIGRVALGEDLSEPQAVKAVMVPGIFGHVFDWWRRLNPAGRPTVLFAPGVRESRWFAEQFVTAGVAAAHVDGEEVWVNGATQPTSRQARADVMEAARTGAVKVLCNRFVLREGIDAPWLEHGILATVFGSLQSYLQAGGRLLRASPGTGKVAATVQDHGGNWWRHGSLNADRQWDLSYTAGMVAGMREDAFRDRHPGTPPEPARCPRCAQILAGLVCPCGAVIARARKTRPVLQHDGSLVQYHGDVFRPRRVATRPDTVSLWKKTYYRARNGGMTFRQAAGLFVHEHHYWPPRTLPLMPRHPADWYLPVASVPKENLL